MTRAADLAVRAGRPCAAVLVALLALSGCADALKRAVVPVPEYAAYRRFRLAESVEQKLGAGYQYLKSHPEGAYRPEVRRYLTRESARYVQAAWNDPARLEAFLAEVPSGTAAERAVVRLVQLNVHGEYASARERELDERAAALTERLEEAELGRRALVVGVASWVRRLSSIRTWGGRTSELDGELLYHYRLTEPSARCTDVDCTKTVLVRYAVPEGKAQSEREAVYDVGLRLEDGAVRAAWITGPELFTRLAEAINVAAVPTTDLVARAEAIGQAAQVIALAAEGAFPAARCTVEPVSPVVVHRVCDGVELRVVSAAELGDEDRVVIAPVPARPGPGAASPEPTPGSAGPPR